MYNFTTIEGAMAIPISSKAYFHVNQESVFDVVELVIMN